MSDGSFLQWPFLATSIESSPRGLMTGRIVKSPLSQQKSITI